MPEHGEYIRGRGYYDSSRRGYVDHATRVTKVSTDVRAPRPDLGAPRTEHIQRPERVGASAAANWSPNTELESIRRLRDSDRPEQRAQAEKLLQGQRRIALANYEAGLGAYLDAGGEVPDGVQRLTP